MILTKITDLVTEHGISSRSLRYYEQMGLIQSVRHTSEKYRYYDAANIERLKQIMVLRKMLIPVKDIIRIYESETMNVVVETFVNRIHSIDDEVNALKELRQIVNEFLQAMLQKGITKISALPILYEGMEKQLEHLGQRKPRDYAGLSALSEKLAPPVNPVIVQLPPMRVLSSYLKSEPQTSDTEGFWRLCQMKGISTATPRHRQFEYQTAVGDVAILHIAEDFQNDTQYTDFHFPGGMFAAVNVYLDEDIGERFRALVASFDENKYYAIDYNHDGTLRHEALLENLISPDEQRVLVSLMVPVKKRLADPALYHKPDELPPDIITVEEIEKQNPILWEMDVPLNKLVPINDPHYKVLETGEVEYISWISTRVLSTNVAVRLPFRVDVEFRVGDGAEYAAGTTEGSICLYHGEHSKDHNYVFGINMDNNADPRLSQEAIRFHQPIFRDFYNFPKRGKIIPNEYNRLTWIFGAKHTAVIINGEVRYCGVNFPYMSLDLSREEARPIVIGSNGQGKKYFKSIKISQLIQPQKNKLKSEELIMTTKRSNNIIPIIHRLVTDEYGENYWFNGCAKYVMECLGEPDYDYWFFAGVTGDIFTQHYPKSEKSYDESRSSYRIDKGDTAFAESVFEKCGYACSFVTGKNLRKNKEMYLQTLLGYIDKGVPVIVWQNSDYGKSNIVGVFVGYEEYGQTLLYITGNKAEPERISFERAMRFDGEGDNSGWIFVGEKKEQKDLGQLYRNAIKNIPQILTTQTEDHYFGAEAFRAWADNIERGFFDNIKPEEFDGWGMYTNFICVLATNGSCCHQFLKRARDLNPGMEFLQEVSKLYKKTANMWNNQNGEDLEALGGGFNVTLQALQDEESRGRIVAKLREMADVIDEVVLVIENGLKAVV